MLRLMTDKGTLSKSLLSIISQDIIKTAKNANAAYSLRFLFWE